MEVVPVPMIFARDLSLRLKRENLGPTVGAKEGRRERVMAQAMEA